MDIAKFQEIIKNTYYTKDNNRGLWQTFGWFVEEIGELARVIRKKDKKAIELEFSDVFAWLVSIANILNIDVSKSLERYKNGCPKCKKIPCCCP